TLLPMDRISSCAASSSSETRISLLVPSRVANLSAMDCGRGETRGNEGESSNFYYFSLITKLQRSLIALQITMNSTSADKQGRTGSSSSQFILSGFDVVWR